VTLDPVTKTHPLVVDRIAALGDVPKAACHVRVEDEVLLALLRKLSKTFSTRDIIEEFVACGCFPVRVGWDISSWLAEDLWIEGIPVPDFATVFSLRTDREFSYLSSCYGGARFALLLTLFASSAMQGWTLLSSRAGPTRWSGRCQGKSTKPSSVILAGLDGTGCSTRWASPLLSGRPS